MTLCSLMLCGMLLGISRVHGYTVVTTVAMIGDIVGEIAQDKAEVTTLIRSGIDPHLYQPTRHDIQQLSGADVVLYVGALLEGKMSTVLDSLRRRNVHIHALVDFVAEQVPTRQEFMHDPHIWMDVALWRTASMGIARALQQFDRANYVFYAANLRAYTAQLDALEQYIVRVMATIPPAQRILITAHDAFAYFGSAYGIRVEGIQGLSTESEAGLRRINDLINIIIDNNIRAIFVESSVNDKNVRSLIEGARARGHRVRIGGVLYSDAMGTNGTYEGTYIGMLDHNATTVAVALGGIAPGRGMQGRLAHGK